MDTVTHGIVGALIGKAFFAENPPPFSPGWTEKPVTPGRVAIISGTIGAIFPDVDVFFARFSHNDLFYLTHHRGITHSLLMLPVYAVALAALTYWVAHRVDWPAPKFGDLTAIYAVALGSHLFLDLITSYGIMLWSPVDHSRPAWDWVLIVDVTLTALALLPQLAAWAFHKPKTAALRAVPTWLVCCGVAFGVVALVQRIGVPVTYLSAVAFCFGMSIFLVMPLRRGMGSRMRRGKWCRVGIALLGTYLAFAGILHRNGMTEVAQFAKDNGLRTLDVAALPMPPSVARWTGIITTPEGYYRVEFNQLEHTPVQIHYYPNPDPNSFITAARNLPEVQTFLWFARFPYFQYTMENGDPTVRIIDLRFLSDGLRARTEPGGEISTIFSYQVVFAPDGRVVSAGLVRPN